MADGERKKLLCQFGSADCRLVACASYDCAALFKATTLQVEGTWLAGNPTLAPVLLIAHLLAGGPCFFLRCPTSPGQPSPPAWAQLHALLAGENRAAVLRTSGRNSGSSAGAEVMLVALTGRGASGAEEAIFVGFVASMISGDFVRQMLIDMRLPLVFDLDETLLVAKSQSQLGKELRNLRDVRRPQLLAATGEPQQKAKLKALDLEERLMQDDLALLQEFAEDDAITYKGQRLVAKIEHAVDEDDRPITRPVIRLPDNEDTLLTRIEPGKPISSMVFKLRPNWRAIWAYLGGLMDPLTNMPIALTPPSPKLRFEAYVCTAAERGYALEAWRVLDPDGWMIPEDKRKIRVISSAKSKTLGSVLRLGVGKLPGAHGRPASPMPLAVIVDDRVEIWDASNQGQVLQVEPFRPWEEQAAEEAGLTGMPTTNSLSAQMVRLKEELFNLRMHVFHRTQEVLRRQLDLLKQQPLDLSRPEQHYHEQLAPSPWVEGLVASGRHRLGQPDVLPQALQAALERPVDPRALRRQQQAQQGQQAQQAQQAGQQAAGQQGQQGKPGVLQVISGPEGAALLASLQNMASGQGPALAAPPDPRMQQQQQQQQMLAPVGPRMQMQRPQMPPADPRMQQPQQQQPVQPPYNPRMQGQALQPAPVDPRFHQQQQQQAMPGYGPSSDALGQESLQQQQQQRPQRHRPGKMAGPQVPPPPQGPPPGVALLQQRAAAAGAGARGAVDPRQRRPAAPAGAAPSASSSIFVEALDMVHGGPPQAPQAQQGAPLGRQQRQPTNHRLVGLPGQPQEQAQGGNLPLHMQQLAVGGQDGGLTQQQSAWGTASAAVAAGPMLPGMQAMPPGPPLRPMQQPGSDASLEERWRNSFGAPPQAGNAHGGAAAGPLAGVKRKASGLPDAGTAAGSTRQKQSRFEAPAGAPPSTAQAAAANGQVALSQLFEVTGRQGQRLQWSSAQQPNGSWQAAAYVGVWPTQYPPPGTQPVGVGTGPNQGAAMEVAAAAALERGLPRAIGGGPAAPTAGTAGARAAPGPQQAQQAQQHVYVGRGPAGPLPGRGGRGRGGQAPPMQAPRGVGRGAGVNSRNALDTLLGHFPGATNTIDWQDQPPGPGGECRCRLVINGGEFDVVGAAGPGPRPEKRARQHAALLVLQAAGYTVSFEAPASGAPGAYGGAAPGGYGGPPAHPSSTAQRGGGPRYQGKSLDARQARVAQQQQQGVSRDAYLASLNDELG